MKFAPIVPSRYIDSIAGRVSDFQMVLAHVCVSDALYLDAYRRRRMNGDFIILDNGACELGTSVSPDVLLTIMEQLGGADVVVIPDTIEGGNCEMLRAFEACVDSFEAASPSVKFMAVPKSRDEIRVFAGVDFVDIIGLNRDWEIDGRVHIIREYCQVVRQFHILGFRRDPMREILSVGDYSEIILGVDSSLPYRIVRGGRRIYENRPFPEVLDFGEFGLSATMVSHCTTELRKFVGLVERGEEYGD